MSVTVVIGPAAVVIRRIVIFGVGCSVVLALVAGCAGGGGSAPGETGAGAATTSALPTPIPEPWLGDAPGELSGEVVEALLRIRAVAPEQFADRYAGIATGSPETDDALVIYLSDGSPEVEVQLTEMAGLPEGKIRFERAYQSLKEATVVHQQLWAADAELRSRGIELLSYGVGVDGVEDIGMDHPSDEQIAELFTLFGPYLRIDPNVGPPRLV